MSDVRPFARSAATLILAAAFAAGLTGTDARAAVPDPLVAAAPSSPVLPDAIRASAAAGHADRLATYVAEHPNDRDAAFLLGDLYVRSGNVAGAEHVFETFLASAPGDREAHDRLGNVYAMEDKIDGAIAQFEKALPDVAAFGDLVRLHRRRGDLTAFVESYRRAADAAPGDASAQFGYGVVLRDLRRPAQAKPFLVAALRDAQPSCAVLTALGNVDLDLGNNDVATDEFRRCLAIDPNDYSALVDLSDTFGPDRAASARDLLNRAVALRPGRPEAYVNLGYLDDAADNTGAAIANDDTALQADPFFRDAYVNLGYAYVEQGRYQDADATCLRGLSVSPGDGRLAFVLGTSFKRQGKPDLAAREYRLAAGSDEPDVAAAATRALAGASSS